MSVIVSCIALSATLTFAGVLTPTSAAARTTAQRRTIPAMTLRTPYKIAGRRIVDPTDTASYTYNVASNMDIKVKLTGITQGYRVYVQLVKDTWRDEHQGRSSCRPGARTCVVTWRNMKPGKYFVQISTNNPNKGSRTKIGGGYVIAVRG